MSTVTLQEVVQHCLSESDQYDRWHEALVLRLHSEGRRLVTHEGYDVVQVVDYGTREVLWTGTASAFATGHGWQSGWTHIDFVSDQVPLVNSPIAGVPDGLLDSVRDWVGQDRASAVTFAAQ